MRSSMIFDRQCVHVANKVKVVQVDGTRMTKGFLVRALPATPAYRGVLQAILRG